MGGIGGIGVQDWQAETEALAESMAKGSKDMGLGRGSAEVKLVEDIAAKVEGKSKYIRKVFRDFDEDFDGTVNHDEFKKGLEHLGVKLTDDKFDMLLKLVGGFPHPFIQSMEHLSIRHDLNSTGDPGRSC